MQLCHQEEADTRLCVHVLDALEKGARNILVTTVDTDVVVLLASMYFQLSSTFSDLQIWVGFGTGNHFRYYDINSISQSLGEQASHALPFFHAFTGCDTTSVKVINQLGSPGKLIQKLLKHFFMLKNILSR